MTHLATEEGILLSSSNQAASSEVQLPKVSALICTRNRGASLVPTVESILHPSTLCAELIIIDQSTDDTTELALHPFRNDPRLRYVRSTTKGKGIALNLGLQMSENDIVAITDDDCVVPPFWPRYQVKGMMRDPLIAISYGNVLAGEYNPTKGFIPAYIAKRDRLCSSVWTKLSARGIGANTVVRRDLILSIGGFDNEVGPGGKFRACIDRDMTLRCLIAGQKLSESKDSLVYHYGFRNWEDGRKLTYDAWYGTGASYIKPILSGKWSAFIVAIFEFTLYALLPFIACVLTLRRPFGWLRIKGFVDGMREGAKTKLDPVTLKYIIGDNMPEKINRYRSQKATETVSYDSNDVSVQPRQIGFSLLSLITGGFEIFKS